MWQQLESWLSAVALDRHDKPTLGVSACLLGHPVRYDGDHKHDAQVTGTLAGRAHLRHYCPEVGIGMSVPRPPIQVVQLGDTTRVRGVAAPHDDVTDALHGYAHQVPGNLDGFVLKARSPSCGAGTTPIVNARNEQVDTGWGAFAEVLRRRFPCAPIIDDSALADGHALAHLLLHAHLYRAWREQGSLTQVYHWRDALRSASCATTAATQHYLELLAAHST